MYTFNEQLQTTTIPTESTQRVSWDTVGLKVTHLGLKRIEGVLVVITCQGLYQGKRVDVALPFTQLPNIGYKANIVTWAYEFGFNAKRKGLLKNITIDTNK